MGIGLYVAEHDEDEEKSKPLDVDIVRKKTPKLLETTPQPVKPPDIEPKPAPEDAKPLPRNQPRRPKQVTRARPAPRPETDTEPTPAPGPVTDDSESAPRWVMPDQGSGGTVPVARGKPTSRRVGSGGTGKSKGGGGPPTSKAKPAPRPVSVASIKRRPKPIGNTDFVDARKNYPADARRLGIEGTIKVRLVVDKNGGVSQRRLIKKLGYGLDALALRLAKKLRFQPAIDTNGNPVAAIVVWTFHFTIPH